MIGLNATRLPKTGTDSRTIAAAKDSRFLTAEAVRNDKSFGTRGDSQVEIQARIKTDVIPNRAESPVRNLLFSAMNLNDRAERSRLLKP
jgi:hypothetical protein